MKVPPKPEKTDEKYVFKKLDHFHLKGSKEEKRYKKRMKKKALKERKLAKKKAKTKVEPSGPMKIRKKEKKVQNEVEKKNRDAALPENVLHEQYEGTKAKKAKKSKKQEQKKRKTPETEGDNSVLQKSGRLRKAQLREESRG